MRNLASVLQVEFYSLYFPENYTTVSVRQVSEASWLSKVADHLQYLKLCNTSFKVQDDTHCAVILKQTDQEPLRE